MDESWLFTRLPALVLGPAGVETDGRGREVEGGRIGCDWPIAGNSVDRCFGEERGGGREETSRGMDGRRRLLVGTSESRLDKSCVLVGDSERGFELEFELERDLELGLEPAGDCLRKSGGDRVGLGEGDRERGRCRGGSNPGGGMDKDGDGFGDGITEAALFELNDLRYCCLKERRF